MDNSEEKMTYLLRRLQYKSRILGLEINKYAWPKRDDICDISDLEVAILFVSRNRMTENVRLK